MNRYFPVLVGAALLLSACNQGSNSQGGNQNEGQPLGVERLEVTPANLTAGESATYTWEVKGDGASCQLDVGADGTSEYSLGCSAGSQTHAFADPGSFPATLSVTLDGQEASRSAPVVTVSAGSSGGNGAFSELTWQPAAVPPYGIAEGQGVSLGGKLYVFGGFDSESPYRCCRPTDRTYVFDPKAETWQPLAPMPPMNGTAYGGVNHAGFTTDEQDIFFAGGYTSNERNTAHIFGTAEVWRYNVVDNSYTRLPNLPEVRGAGQLEYYDGRLYFFGGSSSGRKVDTGDLFILDLKDGATTWHEGAPLPNPRNHLGSAVLSGKIYAVAGQHKHDGKLTTQNDVHSYDPETDSWEQVASLPLAISHNSNSTFVMGGRIIVVGGEVDHLKGVSNVFAYDPKTDAWISLTPLPVAMVDPVAEDVGGKLVVAYDWKPRAFIGTPLE